MPCRLFRAHHSARYYPFHRYAVKKVEYSAERSTHANCCHENHQNDKNWNYFIILVVFLTSQRTSHDFENSRKPLLIAMSQPLLSWSHHTLHNKESTCSCAQLKQRVLHELAKQQEATTQHGSEYENQITKSAIVLICDSMGKKWSSLRSSR